MESTMSRGGRPGPRARGSARAAAGGSDSQYDLLTAALIGVALGVSTTLLLSQAGRLRPRPTAMGMAKRELRRRLESGREEVEGTVERELRALTRAIRRGRRRLGI